MERWPVERGGLDRVASGTGANGTGPVERVGLDRWAVERLGLEWGPVEWRSVERLLLELTRKRRWDKAKRATAVKLSRTARAVVLAILGGGASLGLVAPGDAALGRMTLGQWFVVVAIGALVLGGYLRPLVLYRGEQSITYSIDEGFLVVLILLVPPFVTMATFGLAVLVSQLVWRRSLMKAAFNVGQFLIAVGVALAASGSLGAPHHPFTSGELAMAVVGAGVFFIVNDGLLAAIMVANGSRWQDCVLGDLPVRLGLLGAGALVGGVLAVGVAAHTWTLLLAVLMLVMLAWC